MHTTQLSSNTPGAQQWLEGLSPESTTVIVRDDGAPAAYILGAAAYDQLLHKLELQRVFLDGMADAAAGRTHTQAEVEEMMAKKWSK